jgi:cytochrome c oxidase subunit 1
MATQALAPAARGYRSGLYEWLTTTDHKKIGIMYLINSFIFFFIGGIFALGVRTELAQPGLQFVDDARYNELFTMHATVMIFLFIIPMLAGFGNYVVPLQIGAPDMAFPRINALSFWMLPLGGILLCSASSPAGRGRRLDELRAAVRGRAAVAAAGQDLWIVALILIGTSSILGAINFLVTIFKMRAPGMTLFRMPILVWTMLVTSVLVLMATPVITSALIMLFIDRNYGGTSSTRPRRQRDPLPERLLVLLAPGGLRHGPAGDGHDQRDPAGLLRKPLFGYKAFVFATARIGASASRCGRTTCSRPARSTCRSSA